MMQSAVFLSMKILRAELSCAACPDKKMICHSERSEESQHNTSL